ncbi:peptidylprolyl isomerase [Acidimicrobiia bacterium]|jgi:cyclophilin family peptidyl-prolyl cis-trans isomerase|nr:peptidylprolyl isomerase [Acidimicrobiia bacterium]MDA9844374.1 peptidylprolyl isomerase [Acidimicrobiia bacterium]MDA9845499.1 peptidylprolyl isomerase [Acidimicrobiia bacterium]MDA9860226.1 peptidylprolyl isomerase [Acidimicrobiia bacterium]MDB3891104.1 peptidylprolyl isomerase [Acidimicrobiia bacterium]|tara:strand:+ start:607 stop:1254 length:648 start_codon:yes stop_codon:yes gene_type:complete
MLKKNIYRFLIISLFISACGSNEVEEITETTIQDNKGESTMSDEKVYSSMPEMSIDQSKSYTAVIQTSMGDLSVEFFSDTAPITVNNFISLSNDGYYDNIIFHRVISGFMIQGGDPSGTGHGEYGKFPGYTFEDELNNQQPYEKGILAMANAGPNTNGSQFFIMHVDYPLPYQYTIFGKVTAGLDVIDSIASVQTAEGDKPVEDVVILGVTVSSS